MVFLSYSSQNKQLARQLLESLASEGIQCWFDEKQLDAGATLRTSLLSAISESDIYVYLASKAANKSKWVQDELRHAIALELENMLEIVPVAIAQDNYILPSLLPGRVFEKVDGTKGSFARIAHNLVKRERARSFSQTCPTLATIRLDKKRLMHTLGQARQYLRDSEIRVSLLNKDYESLEELYWEVSDAEFSLEGVHSAEQRLETDKTIREIHRQSRSIIKEASALGDRFVKTKGSNDVTSYHDAGHERILHILLHRLQWNITYLRAIRDGLALGKDFLESRQLQEAFGYHRCNFVSAGREIGSANVPGHAHPLYPNVKKPLAWGLTNPFLDMFPAEVGTAVGEIVALQFINQPFTSAAMPSPDSLQYGLS